MGVVGKEQAAAEVSKWLDMMNIPEATRGKEQIQVYVSVLEKAVCEGVLIFQEDESITQRLKHNLGDGDTKEINYNFRYDIGEYQAKTKGTNVFEDEVEFRVARLSLISTNKSFVPAVFKKMKREDYFVAAALTVFF